MKLLAAAVLGCLPACTHLPRTAPDVTVEMEQFPWKKRTLRMEVFRPADIPVRKSVVYLLHGVGGMLGDGAFLREVAAGLARDGHEAVVVRYFDATGHWAVNRSIAMRRGEEWRDVLVAMMTERRRSNPDARTAIVGYSLGSFLGVAIASDSLDLDRLVVVSGGILEQYEENDLSRLPPTLILHGGRDRIVLPDRSALLAELAGKAGVTMASRSWPNEGHAYRREARGEIVQDIRSFLKE